jgi:asparagine synthetase B (glutamine-hydrolysing)
MAFAKHLAGWLAIAGIPSGRLGAEKLTAGLLAFRDDYGTKTTVVCRDDLGFGFVCPENPLPLSTWSLYQDPGALCFVEGVFYGNFGTHVPTSGEDRGFARVLLERFRELGEKSIAGLNGAFCGVVLDFQKRQLVTFVDRLGARVVYWSQTAGKIIVSSKLTVLKELKKLHLDATAAYQALTIGFPIGRRTLIQDVQIQRPCSVMTARGNTITARPYWDPPQRLSRLGVKDAAAMIGTAMDNTVERFANRIGQPIGIGLSGGHDSRVILASLIRKQLPFTPFMWADGDFNDVVAPRLAAVAGKTPAMVRPLSDCQIWKMKHDVFRYSDGSYFHSTGFPRLGRECFQEKVSCLTLGFAGDKIGGLAMVPAVHHPATIKSLARAILKNQMELLSFAEAGALLGKSAADTEERTLSEWSESFEIEGESSLVDVAMWQAIFNRNFKRIRPQMIAATQYVQLLFPYLDNAVMDAYFSLPMELIHHQRAHCYAGFYNVPAFGSYRACSYPISLRNEAAFPFALYGLRVMAAKVRPFRSRWNSRLPTRPWSEYQQRIWQEVFDSSLFDKRTVQDMFQSRRLSMRALHAMHTLYRFQQTYL